MLLRDYSDINNEYKSDQPDVLATNYEAEFNQFMREEEGGDLDDRDDSDSDIDAEQIVKEEMFEQHKKGV